MEKCSRCGRDDKGWHCDNSPRSYHFWDKGETRVSKSCSNCKGTGKVMTFGGDFLSCGKCKGQ